MLKGKLNVGGKLGMKLGKLNVGGKKDAAPEEPLEQALARELSEVEQGFNARRAEEERRMNQVLDPEFWFAVYFQNREQKEHFLKALRLIDLGDKYVEGQEAARRLGIALPPAPPWPTREKSAARLIPLSKRSPLGDD